MPSHLGYGMNVPYLDRGPKAVTEYHTLTNLPFKPTHWTKHRYSQIGRPLTAMTSQQFSQDIESKDSYENTPKQCGGEYAKFLKGQEDSRVVGPSQTFIDSRRYIHSFRLKLRPPSATSVSQMPTSVVSMRSRLEEDEKEFEKKMKIIEDHMWKHKQEERELKRMEGDVKKSKRLVMRIARDFESSKTREMLEEEKKLTDSIKKIEKTRVEGVRMKQARTRARSSRAQSGLRQRRKVEREKLLVRSDAERQYKRKISEMEMKKSEMARLTRAFEEKLLRHENETHKISKELADLSIQMNMEAMRAKAEEEAMKRDERIQVKRYVTEDRRHEIQMSKKMRKTHGISRGAENRRRRASGELSGTISHISERLRDGDRRVSDNQHRVEMNMTSQRKLQEATEATKLEKRKKELERKVEGHVIKKMSSMQTAKEARRRIDEERSESWKKTFEEHQKSYLRGRNRDLLRSLEKVVQSDGEMEMKMYQRVKKDHQMCQSGQQMAKKLKQKVIQTRFAAGRKNQEEILRSNLQEKNLLMKLKKAESDLIHLQNVKSTSESLLHKYRNASNETKFVCEQLNEEQKRLDGIGEKTDHFNTITVM